MTIYRNEALIGIDAAINRIQSKLSNLSFLDISLNDSPFFGDIFPLAYKSPENKPIWYAKDKNDYIGIAPNDNAQSVAWFYLDGQPTQIAHNTEQASVNLVVWFISKEIDNVVNDMTKVLANAIRYELFRSTTGSYQNPQYFYNKEDIFSEYSFSDEILKSYMPYSALRIRFDLTYKIECKPEYTQQNGSC